MGSSAPRADGVVAIGASAGGVEALTELVAGLPAKLPDRYSTIADEAEQAMPVLAKRVLESDTGDGG